MVMSSDPPRARRRIKDGCKDEVPLWRALFPSKDDGTKGGTCQAASWYKELLCTALITTGKDSVLQASKD